MLELRGSEPFSFLMNGWNEISEGTAESAVQALRELEQSYASAGIIVATRTHRLRPPLPGAFRARLITLTRSQRDEYLTLALGNAANELRARLDNSRKLNELVRTPLFLAEVTELFRRGSTIPTTKIGVLAGVIRLLEESDEHHVSLQQAPLSGHAGEYLGVLSMEMTEKGSVEIDEADARAIVNSASAALQKARQIGAQPDPSSVLNELSKHHVLEPLNLPGVTFRFQHQQFQEFFAARSLKSQLLQVVRDQDAGLERKFAKQYVNEPRWGESLVMLAEEIAAEGAKAEFVEAGTKLVRMALHVDPIFAADLANACGLAVWAAVRDDVGKRLRDLHAQKDGHYRRCALAAMIATGSDDFRDILVPLLTDANEQVRLSTYHTGAQVLPSNLGPNWRDVALGWPEEVRRSFVTELARDPWLADNVEELALADPSAKVRWSAANMLSWSGFTEKAEKLMKSIDDASFRQVALAPRPDKIPVSQLSRVVAVHEQLYNEAGDPFERLRFLHVLQAFGVKNIVERIKAELDGLGPDQLQTADHQRQIEWALDGLQESDPKWVSEWATRKVLDKSNWFGAWRGLITQIPGEEQEELYARFSAELLDKNEQQRVVSVLVSVMSPALTARVFERACEIRAGLTPPPGHDQAKWDHFRQFEDLLRGVAPATLLEGISNKLDQEPVSAELDILTEILPATNLTKPDVRSSVSEEMRVKFRAYLKQGAKLGAEPDGLRANTRAHLAMLLGNVGEPEDLADIRRLIEADSIRFERAKEARAKGDHSQDIVGYGFLYYDAVMRVDPKAADELLVELVRTQQYEHVLSQRLPMRAHKTVEKLGFGTDRMDFKRIWKARAGEADERFVEERRSRFADAIVEEIEQIKKDREGAADKRGFDHRLKIWGGALAVLDGKRSAKLILELMELPGCWDGWTRVGAIESLLLSGLSLSLEEVLRILEPTFQDLRPYGVFSDDQARWLFARYLCVMAFVDPPAPGIAKIREFVSGFKFPAHDMGSVVAALGASRCDDAVDALIEFAEPDGKGVDALGESWIKAIGALECARSTEILLSFVDPNARVFNREFIPDHHHGDLLGYLLAERATKDKALKGRLMKLANGDLPSAKRMLVAKVFGQFTSEDDRVEVLCVLRDDGLGVPYELVRLMENAFLERRPYGSSGNAYTLSPLRCNAIRKQLFEMVIGDQTRKQSAFALLGQIEVWRLEHGHPPDEPRHPVIESEVSWPPILLETGTQPE